MNELRFVRREERSLILANANDEEFRIVIDDLLLSELKHAGRKEREVGRVRPREIQALVRAGKSRAEIAALTGLEEAHIERYEEPVLAERRYILDRAHAIAVRTDANGDGDEQFGAVIAERLIVLEAEATDWSAWRDEETGWMVCLEFISRDVAHRALWSFDHRKQTLAPVNSDAVSLSKQGEVGDRLIPKLRAVDNEERTSQFAAAVEPIAPVTDTSTAPTVKPTQTTETRGATAHSDASSDRTVPVSVVPLMTAAPTASSPVEAAAPTTTDRQQKPAAPLDVNAEYVRRREIDQRAIKSEDASQNDFSQTADLLDALRRRRGERKLAETQTAQDGAGEQVTSAEGPESASTHAPAPEASEAPAVAPPVAEPAAPAESPAVRGINKSRSIWGGAGVAAGVPTNAVTGPPAEATPKHKPQPDAEEAAPPAAGAVKKGRASIPSWDDILFGTRSDEDPSIS